MNVADRGRFQWKSPWTLAVAAAAALIVFVLGVMFGIGVFRPSTQPGPPVASSPTPSGSPSPTESPSQSAWGVLLKDFLVEGGPSYIVTIVGTDGTVSARATPAQRSHPSGVLVQMPNVSSSNSRLYYLDGDATVRYLMPDGRSGSATTLPVDAKSAAVFSVSPDDTRIAVAVITYPFPAKERLYVENLAGGGNHVELGPPSNDLEWPVGWHQGRLVMGVGLNVAPQNAFEGFAFAPMGYRLIDPASGAVVSTVCAGRQISGPSVPAGTVCETDSMSYVVADWSGSTRSVPTSPGCHTGMLSPDGAFTADDCYGGMMRLVDSHGTMFDGGGLSAAPLGWIDNSHYIGRAPGGQLSVFETSVRSGQVTVTWKTGIMASGFFAARIPGGL